MWKLVKQYNVNSHVSLCLQAYLQPRNVHLLSPQAVEAPQGSLPSHEPNLHGKPVSG